MIREKDLLGAQEAGQPRVGAQEGGVVKVHNSRLVATQDLRQL
jgi:hypothetical protein